MHVPISKVSMKRALVTGGTKGIGLGIVRMLIEEGYYTIITYSSDQQAAICCERELSLITQDYEIIQADQNDYDSLRALVAHVCQSGRIDCLVCNAGTTLRKDIISISNEEWESVMNVNVNSNFYLIRDLYNNFSSQARIVLIGSVLGIYPHSSSLAYGVTKAAVHALAKNLVKSFEGTMITVNAIAPGFVETEWQKDKPEEIRNNIYSKTAAGRFAAIDEVADVVRLCINNSYLNGSIIEIDGGYCYK